MEVQKAATVNAQTVAAKQVEDTSRELQKKVGAMTCPFSHCMLNVSQAAEVDQLRHKLKRYSDYDEVKRELEIMKASEGFWSVAMTSGTDVSLYSM